MQINAETGHKTTYSKIFQDTVNTATGLRKLGVKRGDVLAFCSENRDEYIAAALGAVCCGATITTTNMQYSKGEIPTYLGTNFHSTTKSSKMTWRKYAHPKSEH